MIIEDPIKKDSVKLQAFLARAGVYSRRKSEKIILEGRVKVNNKIIDKLGCRVFKDDKIFVDDQEIRTNKKNIYLVLNKPKGFACTPSNNKKTDLALDLIQGHFSQRLFPFVELDIQSSGLVFYTNNGEFLNSINFKKIEKEYIITIQKGISENCINMLKSFRKGIYILNTKYKIERFKVLNRNIISLISKENKTKNIKKVFEKFRITIRNIKRIRIGKTAIEVLREGYYRPLIEKEITFLKEAK